MSDFDFDDWDYYDMKSFADFIEKVEKAQEQEQLLQEEVEKQWVKDQYDNDPEK